jgi:hypothetical protein
LARYDLTAYLEARLSAARYESKHPDLASYHGARYRALRAVFGIDLEQLPTPLDWTFDAAVQCINGTSGAFDGSMESHPGLRQVFDRHYGHIARAVRSLRDAHLALMRDIVETAFGPCDRVVTSEELSNVGFDDSDPPDSVDYW